MNKRFIFTMLTLVILAVGGIIAAYIAKGYRVSSKTGMLIGTGIISVTSVPDQASVYLDGHLITATNSNINSLEPKTYSVKIHKDGYIDWENKIDVKEGLVIEIKATLFPALPSVYPLTQNGAIMPTLSPDSQKVTFIVPGNTKKSGVWVWTMAAGQIGFARGGEPHQIMTPTTDTDLARGSLRWSPDSKQVLLSLVDRHYLLDQDKVNDPARDITPILQPTLKGWEDDQKQLNAAKVAAINNIQIRQTASNSAYLKWSVDETKFIHSQDGQTNFKVTDLKFGKSYDLPSGSHYLWLPDSLHLVAVDTLSLVATSAPTFGLASPSPFKANFPAAKISIIEFQGTNKSEIFAGNFDPASVFPWPDSSRVVMLYSLPTTTASQPNLYGVNLK